MNTMINKSTVEVLKDYAFKASSYQIESIIRDRVNKIAERVAKDILSSYSVKDMILQEQPTGDMVIVLRYSKKKKVMGVSSKRKQSKKRVTGKKVKE